MAPSGFSYFKRLTGTQTFPLYSALDADGDPVLLEPVESAVSCGGLNGGDDGLLGPIERELRRTVESLLGARGLCSLRESSEGRWRVYPNPARCTNLLRETRPRDPRRLVGLALSIVSWLERLHNAGLLFCRPLEPHVVWNPETGDALLVGLHRSLPRSLAGLVDTGRLRIECAEQWRSHRTPPDERLDILLCGGLLAGLMRDESEPGDAALSRVAGVMAAVDPEDRYQSLASVSADLRRARDGLKPSMKRFSYLQSYYASGRLYGVEAAESELAAALTGLRLGGRIPGLVAVRGESGTGKSALCLDLLRRMLDDRTFSLQGKFHSRQTSSPLCAITEAISGFMGELLQEGETSRERVAGCLRSISAPSRNAIASMVPELHLLLEEQLLTADEAVTPRKTSAAYAELLWALSADTPVCIFLDDCQWADRATLELIRLVLSGEPSSLLVVVATRNLPRMAAAYFDAMLDDLEARAVKVTRIQLGPVDPRSFAALLADSTGVDRATLEPRIEGGDVQILPAALQHQAQLREIRRAVRPLPDSSGFRIAGSIRIEDGEDAIRESFRLRLDSLDLPPRRIVEVASALGRRFDLSELIGITAETVDEVVEALLLAVGRRLVRPVSRLYVRRGEFRFEHDIAQEIVYRSMSKRRREELHAMIAARLEQSDGFRGSSLVFDVAEHAHRESVSRKQDGDGLTTQETSVYFRRQCDAGNAAFRTGAFAAAAEYFRRACQVAAVERLALTPPLHQCIESFIAVGELDRAAGLLHSVDVSTVDLITRARLEELDLRLELKRAEERSLEERTHYARFYTDARAILARHSIRLPRADSRLRLMLGLIKAVVAGRTMTMLSGQRETSELSIVLGRLLSHAATLAYIQSAELSMRVHLKVVRFVRRRHAAAAAPYSFALLGALLAVALGRQEAGRRLGRIAERQLEYPANTDARGRTLFHIYGSIMPMHRPYRESDLPLREAYLSCIEARETTFAGLCTYTRLLHRFFAGESLDELLRELERSANLVASGRGAESMLVLTQAVRNLRERVDEPWLFRGPVFDEEVAKGTDQPRTGPAIVSAVVALACGRYDVARIRSRLDVVERNSISAVPTIIIHDFLLCFCALVLDGRLDPSLARPLRRLANAARHCPSNFAHLSLLIRGERERSRGRLDAARNLYQRAAEQAERESCGYAAVIAYSRLSDLARERGFAHVAAMFESTADDARDRWRGVPPQKPPSTDLPSQEPERVEQGRSFAAEGGEAGRPPHLRSDAVGESYARSYLSGVDVYAAVSALKRSMETDELFTESGLRVSELAAHVGLTAHQLAELFSRYLRTSFARYVNAYRVNYAAEQIRRHRDVNLIDIAYQSGFSSKAAFNVAFKQGTGLTPTQYRRQAAPSENDAPPT